MLEGPVEKYVATYCKYADALRPSGKSVATCMYCMASDWDPLASILPQTPKQYIFHT